MDLSYHNWFMYIVVFSILTGCEGSELSHLIDAYLNFQHSGKLSGIWVIIIHRFVMQFAAFWQGARDLSYHNWLLYSERWQWPIIILCALLLAPFREHERPIASELPAQPPHKAPHKARTRRFKPVCKFWERMDKPEDLGPETLP